MESNLLKYPNLIILCFCIFLLSCRKKENDYDCFNALLMHNVNISKNTFIDSEFKGDTILLDFHLNKKFNWKKTYVIYDEYVLSKKYCEFEKAYYGTCYQYEIYNNNKIYRYQLAYVDSSEQYSLYSYSEITKDSIIEYLYENFNHPLINKNDLYQQIPIVKDSAWVKAISIISETEDFINMEIMLYNNHNLTEPYALNEQQYRKKNVPSIYWLINLFVVEKNQVVLVEYR